MHTFTKIYLHVVFATWSRRPFIVPALRSPLHHYIAGTARNLGMFDVEVGGVEDHVHLLARCDPDVPVAPVIGRIKQSSTRWMHDAKRREFRWQRGFSALSVSFDRVPSVVKYIRRQEEHHARRSFAEELEKLLEACGVRMDAVRLL